MNLDQILRLAAFIVGTGLLASGVVLVFTKREIRVFYAACVIFLAVLFSVVSNFNSISINTRYITIAAEGRSTRDAIAIEAQESYDEYATEPPQSPVNEELE